jgi:hypothetical protein
MTKSEEVLEMLKEAAEIEMNKNYRGTVVVVSFPRSPERVYCYKWAINTALGHPIKVDVDDFVVVPCDGILSVAKVKEVVDESVISELRFPIKYAVMKVDLTQYMKLLTIHRSKVKAIVDDDIPF